MTTNCLRLRSDSFAVCAVRRVVCAMPIGFMQRVWPGSVHETSVRRLRHKDGRCVFIRALADTLSGEALFIDSLSTSKAAGFQMRFNWLVDIPRRIVIVRPAEGVFFGMRVQFRVM